VALTFDDGPDPRCTPRILEILAQFRARATFFVIGRKAERYPSIVRAIVQAGHEVGSHTYGHRPLWLLSPAQTREEIERGAQALTTLLGERPRYFRPPWGRLNLAAIRHSRRLGQCQVLWSLRAEGWLPLASPARIVDTVARRLHPGAIIGLHDGGGLWGAPARTEAALPGVLALLQARGYRCLRLSDLLAAPPPTATRVPSLNRLWDCYERVWNAWYGVERLGHEAILALGPAVHYGPDIILRDGTMVHPGAQVGELHLDRLRLADLHHTVSPRALGMMLRHEIEHTLQKLAQLVVAQSRYERLEAFRSTTLFWREARHLGFEVDSRDSGWHLGLIGRYQRLLLARDHPLGRRRLQGKRWVARTIWLSRRELLRRYGGQHG
jgi:peptidoglycan/xylan/chitin deacetylase (PgdA/CDA1 family)